MNQPIPRPFFKDGQRAKYEDTIHGTIKVLDNGTVNFVFINLARIPESLVLLYPVELVYTRRDLELLDRTIDQVMQGDTITTGKSTRNVVGRTGDVIFTVDEKNYTRWHNVHDLKDQWTIIQPSNPEVMTDETAKALREEAMSKVYVPKWKAEYYYWNFRNGEYFQTIWSDDDEDFGNYYLGNIHKDIEGAEYYGEHYAPAFLHVFKE